MVLQASGAISFSNIKAEFQGATPIVLSHYYTNATQAYTTGVTGLPATGASISLSAFYGKAKPAAVSTMLTDFSWYLNANSFTLANATTITSWERFNAVGNPTFYSSGGYNNGKYVLFYNPNTNNTTGTPQYLTNASSLTANSSTGGGYTTFLVYKPLQNTVNSFERLYRMNGSTYLINAGGGYNQPIGANVACAAGCALLGNTYTNNLTTTVGTWIGMAHVWINGTSTTIYGMTTPGVLISTTSKAHTQTYPNITFTSGIVELCRSENAGSGDGYMHMQVKAWAHYAYPLTVSDITNTLTMMLNDTAPIPWTYPPGVMTSVSTTFSGLSYGNGTYNISSYAASTGLTVVNAFDGNKATYYQAAHTFSSGTTWNGTSTTFTGVGTLAGPWIRIDLPKTIRPIEIGFCPNIATNGPKNYQFLCSTDGTNWTSLINTTAPTYTGTTGNITTVTNSLTSRLSSYSSFVFVWTSTNAGAGNSYPNLAEFYVRGV